MTWRDSLVRIHTLIHKYPHPRLGAICLHYCVIVYIKKGLSCILVGQITVCILLCTGRVRCRDMPIMVGLQRGDVLLRRRRVGRIIGLAGVLLLSKLESCECVWLRACVAALGFESGCTNQTVAAGSALDGQSTHELIDLTPYLAGTSTGIF